jgi:DNA topoisomerase-6 subunit B
VTLAEELAKQQRSISVAEFFEKNKHLLGFDSPTRGIITTIKEAVDNALDACEEAQVLPDLFVGVVRTGKETLRITVEDNGPGIVKEQIPFVFGKLLYGSRFHQIRQSRGQQGIGISAAVLYAQLTTGIPATVISRTGAKHPAMKFRLLIRSETNEPEIVEESEIPWDRIHGTRVEIEFASNLAAKKRLVDYLRYTSIVNPHARIRVDVDGEEQLFDRVSNDVPPAPKSIAPHPHGIEFGRLKRMAQGSAMALSDFLVESFSRVGEKTAAEILQNTGIKPGRKAKSLSAEELKILLAAMQEVAVPPPPAGQCLSPIGEDLIRQGLEKEFQLDFVRARTRPPRVYSGHPFIVEAAIGYGGKLTAEGTAQILRFANRVPLLYQQGACAITGAIASVNWKSYGLSQQSVPVGPVMILVHVASTNVPFTSESKDAVAGIPEIEREIVLALQELGRDLKQYLNRREKNRQKEERARAICSIIPDIARKVGEVLDQPPPDTSQIEGQIMRRVVAKKQTRDGLVTISVQNYTRNAVTLMASFMTPDVAGDAKPKPDFSDRIGEEFNHLWKVELDADEGWESSFHGSGAGTMDIRGVDDRMKVVVDHDLEA